MARSIEEQLYPSSGESDVDSAAPAHEGPQAADAPPVRQEASPDAKQQDSWKEYDIEGKKTDWKGYDIEGGGRPEPASREVPPGFSGDGGPPAEEAKAPETGRRASDPDDSEVEMALSGLKEVSEQSGDEASADEVVTLNEKEVVEEAPSRAPQGGDSAEPKKVKQPTAVPPNNEESEWSMEELRKNLSNLNRDEGN